MMNIKTMDAVILCGGLGTRLRNSIGERQKVMAQIGKEPFLNILLRYLKEEGLRRVILCVGYQAQELEDYYKNKDFGLELLYSKETEPLGTGGAIQQAKSFIKSDVFLALNGDSYCAVSIAELLKFHQTHKALGTVVVSQVQEQGGFGQIVLDDNNRIVEFKEKEAASTTTGLVNAGVYIFDKRIFSFMPDKKKFSLEYDVFPQIIDQGLYGFSVGEEFIDIGTPERYQQAKKILGKDG